MTERTENSVKREQDFSLRIAVFAKRNTSQEFRLMMDSLLKQGAKTLTVIVADMNEPGDPYSLSLQEDIRQYSGVRMMPLPENSTAAKLRNQALEDAQEDYIAFIAASDQWDESKTSRQIALMEQQEGSAACCCNGLLWLDWMEVAEKAIYEHMPDSGAAWLQSSQTPDLSQILYRTDKLKELGGFDPRMDAQRYCDLDALLRLEHDGSVVFSQQCLFHRGPSAHELMDPEKEYLAAKNVYYRHQDLMLRSKALCAAYQYRLSKLAAGCGLYVQCVIHAIISFEKRPFHAIAAGVTKTVSAACRAGRIAVRSMQAKAAAFEVRSLVDKMKKLGPDSVALPSAVTAAQDLAETPEIDSRCWETPFGLAFNKKLKTVEIPAYMTRIPSGMFFGCENLTHVILPASVQEIGPYAFMGCKGLQTVEADAGSLLREIGAFAFAGCVRLRDGVFPSAMQRLGAYCFAGCASLAGLRFVYNQEGARTLDIRYPALLKEIPRGAFAGCKTMSQVYFPNGALLSAIGKEAFLGCSALRTLHIESTVTQIGAYAFAHCQELKEIVMPHIDSIAAIGPGAFMHCGSLEYFQIPAAMTLIQKNCFLGCAMLQSITIHRGIMQVDSRAFAQCSSLASVSIDSNITKCVPNAFEGCTLNVMQQLSEKVEEGT